MGLTTFCTFVYVQTSANTMNAFEDRLSESVCVVILGTAINTFAF